MATKRKWDVAPLYELIKKSNYKPVKPPADAPPPTTIASPASRETPAAQQSLQSTKGLTGTMKRVGQFWATLSTQTMGAKKIAPPAEPSRPTSSEARLTPPAEPAAAKSPPSISRPKPPTEPAVVKHPLAASHSKPPIEAAAVKPAPSAFAAAKSASQEPVLLDQITARLNPLFLIAGVIGVIFIVFLAFWIIGRIPGGSSSNVQQPVGAPAGDINPAFEPMPAASNQPQLPSVPAPSAANNNPSVVSPAAPGQVVPAIDVPRSPNLVYLVILTTQERYAQNAAAFLAEHGVDVTIERGLGNLVTVVSVQGFAKRSSPEASAFRHKVVQIGELFPGAHNGESVWGDAYYSPIHRND